MQIHQILPMFGKSYRHTDDRTLMTFKHFQTRALHHVPAPDGKVCTSGEQNATSGVNRHAGHGPRMTFHDLQLLTCLEVPGPGCEVCRAGDQDVLAGVKVKVDLVLVFVFCWDEDERVDAAFVTSEDSNALPCVEIPSPSRAVIRACEDKVSGADHSTEMDIKDTCKNCVFSVSAEPSKKYIQDNCENDIFSVDHSTEMDIKDNCKNCVLSVSAEPSKKYTRQ